MSNSSDCVLPRLPRARHPPRTPPVAPAVNRANTIELLELAGDSDAPFHFTLLAAMRSLLLAGVVLQAAVLVVALLRLMVPSSVNRCGGFLLGAASLLAVAASACVLVPTIAWKVVHGAVLANLPLGMTTALGPAWRLSVVSAALACVVPLALCLLAVVPAPVTAQPQAGGPTQADIQLAVAQQHKALGAPPMAGGSSISAPIDAAVSVASAPSVTPPAAGAGGGTGLAITGRMPHAAATTAAAAAAAVPSLEAHRPTPIVCNSSDSGSGGK